jgi:hypothetical protein
MTVLEKSARNQLDKAVQAARRAATTGADRALRALSVEQEKKPAHLSSEQSELRRQLRVVCRRLGSWDALIRAAAYEQWHRMLFARFLAENKLLIHPKYQAAVSLDECAELARERGIDQWEVAAEFAAGMLPGIFQKDDPLLLLKFAPEDRAALQGILSGIPAETFCTQDALGWTYQFWQTEEKERVNKSERKIEGADICTVTQLFTEPYMVQFLLQNTLGAWWLHLHPESPLRNSWLYYKDQVQHDFSAFPKTAKEIKLLDPACGSGHFIIEEFHMLLAMRLEDGESRENAIKGIVRDNLHGLELDPRCIQIAGFAVAMEAWKSGYPTDQYLPLPNLACVGLPIRAEKTEWLKLAAGDGLLENTLGHYYDLFKNADSLGSLIQIHDERTLVPHEMLMQKLGAALAKEKAIGDPVAEAFGETASGILKAVQYLRRKDFHIVVTNPPFLGWNKFSEKLKMNIKAYYPNFKNDIATCFIERCRHFVLNNGYYTVLTPQNWLFLKSFSVMREKLLKTQKFLFVVKLGENAFESTAAAGAFVALIAFKNCGVDILSDFYGVECSDVKGINSKIGCLVQKKPIRVNQLNQLKNHQYIVIFSNNENLLKKSAKINIHYGSKPGQTSRVIRMFWELPEIDGLKWTFMETSPENKTSYSGKNLVCKSLVQIEKEKISEFGIRGSEAWSNNGIIISQMRDLPSSLYCGHIFDNNTKVLIPENLNDLPALWAYIQSGAFLKEVRHRYQKLDANKDILESIPFYPIEWQKIADEMGPLPEPHSDDPTQWLFKGDIIGSEQPLHVAIARMLSYHWPEQPAGEDPLDCIIDKDGIVCIPPVWGERPAGDWLRSILAISYGGEWSPRKEEELLKQAGYTKSGGLEGFLRDDFFKSHCVLFHHRPFMWMVWDGTKDGFSALVNYHKLDHNTLQKLIYTYLGNWITQQKDDVKQEKAGAERRLAAAEALKENLEKILEGEKPYDIYVRWKPLREQAIGWEPDLNDGVRMNIRPFIEAGVLRWTPNIKWGKDRGTDPVPNCSGTTERLNDLHFTVEEKRKARENVGKTA